MRYLQNENDTLVFKTGDTSETIRLSARNDNQPTIWSDGDQAEIHVDKDNAHVKTVTGTLVTGSNNVTFSTSELSDLPAGKYQLEVWTKLASDGTQAIWPSQGMLDFTIDRNADSLEGGSITTITLDSFKDQLNKAIKEAKAQATPGKSAYQLWLDEGNKGTEQDFLASLKGEKGDAGATGETGKTGQPGLSAYQLAVQSGFKGSEKEWLDFLRKGPQGPQGEPGKDGKDGQSAYQIWLNDGHKGTETDFLNSLIGQRGERGPQGEPGRNGQDGAQGPAGAPGRDGQNGKDGATPTLKIGTITSVDPDQPAKAELIDNKDNSYTLNLTLPRGAKGETGGINQVVKPELTIGTVTTVNSSDQASASLTKTSETGYAINLNIPAGKAGQDGKQGPQGEPGKAGADGKNGADGQPGKDGKDGKSAYELAVSQGFVGDLKSWLASLKGAQGPAGKDGERGTQGEPGPAGKDGKNGQDGQPGPAGKDGKNGRDGSRIFTAFASIDESTSPRVALSSVNIPDERNPKSGDYLIATASNGQQVIVEISDVDSNYVYLDGMLTPIEGPQGPQGPAGRDGRDGKDATANITVNNGLVDLNDRDLGIVSENSSNQLHQSDFNYHQDMAIRIIPQSNFKTWAGISGGSWTLDVDDNTLTNEADNSKKIKLMTGMYLLRDISSDIKVKSTSSFNMKNGELISQITQLIVTPYMVVANAVVTESVNGSFTTKVEAYWRPNWDTDYSPYYGVSNDWRKL